MFPIYQLLLSATRKPFRLLLNACFVLSLLLCRTHSLNAQSTLPLGSSSTVEGDYIIPAGITAVTFTLVGGDGGDAITPNFGCRYSGGRGARIKGSFPVSANVCVPGQVALRPGGILRFVRGKNGQNGSESGQDRPIGCGGGGSAVLYQLPGTSNWRIIMVAGGGGGAHANRGLIGTNCFGGNGFDASLTENGTSGGGNYAGQGGTEGLGGAAGGLIPGDGGGGGGAYRDGGDGSILSLGGDQGFFEGGFGGRREVGASFVRGGNGFGGGGARNIAGGGGGGYSGGGGGSENGYGAGGGGGSFVAPEAYNVERSVFGADLFDGGSIRTSVTVGSNLLASARVYVNAAATGANDGSTWTNAYTKLQDALANTCGSATEIWVARGTYYPDEGVGYTNNSRTAAFILRNKLTLYGGFAGNETSVFQRNLTTNITILSGDIDQNDGANFTNMNGNSYHVVSNGSNILNNTAFLSGFTISGGNANINDNVNNVGGGLYCNNASPVIANCRFTKNFGNVGGAVFNANNAAKFNYCVFIDNRAIGSGAMYNVAADVELTNCDFSSNLASFEAGAVHNYLESDAKILNCRFWNNQGSFGGAIVNSQSSYANIVNSIFYNNTAETYGGAMFNFRKARATVTNCSFSNNSASLFGSSIASGDTAVLIATNCIFWGSRSEIFTESLSTATVTYSIVQCGETPCYQAFPGVGNKLSDPLFTNAANGDLTVSLQSPALNSGNDAANTELLDLAGNGRKVVTIDIGAYEVQITCPGVGNILYVNRNATGAGTGRSWADAFTNLQDALAESCPLVNQIWVAKGTYYPDEGGGKINNDRRSAFTMKQNVAIYGGFAGNETMVSQRNYKLNPTILSGDIDQNDNPNIPVIQLKSDPSRSGNSYRVFDNAFQFPLGPGARVDGFTITGANYNDLANGGGMYNFNASPVIANCIFYQNEAGYGGAICNVSNSSPEIINCLFINNQSELGGGAMGNFLNSSPRIINSTFAGNLSQLPGNLSPTAGGALDNSSNSNAVLINCILWNNMGANSSSNNGIAERASTTTIRNSLVQAGFAGTGNISATPLFVNEAGGDYRLQPGSPAINAGDNAGNAEPLDLDANLRRLGVIDMGAYELQSSCAPISLITNTLTALDVSGCNTSAISSVSFAYSTSSVSLTPAQYNTINLGINANSCAIASVSYADVLNVILSTTARQVIDRSFTIRDINGITVTATQRITVEDKTPPAIITQNITAQLTPGGDVFITPQQVDNGSSDACGTITLSLNKTRFLCENIGQNIVTLTGTDANGNTSRGIAIVTVVDNAAPTVITRNITAQINEGGIAVITPAMIDNGSFDACGIREYSISQSDFFCNHLGVNIITLSVTDVNGNVGSATALVTVEDNVGPTIITQNITAQIDAGGIVEITSAMIDNGSFDACGLASLTLSKTRFDCFDLGANTVTITALDVNGNTSTATAIVTVEDNVGPTMFTRNITAQIDAGGVAIITAAMVNDGSFDACGLDSFRLDKTRFDCFDLGANTVTLTGVDVNGNSASATAIVTVEDNVGPTMFTRNITAQIDAGGVAIITPAMVNDGSFDACGLDSFRLDKTRFDCFELGANTVTLTGVDVNGNSASATAIVTVEDNVGPTMFTRNTTAQIDAGGVAIITAAMVNDGSFDACGLDSFRLDKTRFDCFDVGANTVTLTGVDANGNSASATATVTVEDNVAPTVLTRNITVQLDDNGSVTIADRAVDNGSFDACGLVLYTLSKVNFDCSNLGNNTVTLTVKDANNNSASATAIITVQGAQSYRWVMNNDGDGFYTGVPVFSCAAPGAGYVLLTNQQPGDCDDNNKAVYPGAAEVCDGIDNNCNGLVDDGIVPITPLFNFDTLICSNTAAPVLPAISNNGIAGTWSPAIVSNTVSGTYNFKPVDGQCAGEAAVTVTVIALPDASISTLSIVSGASTGNQAIVPDAGIGAQYNWTIVNGTITAGLGTPSVVYTAGSTGSVTLRVSVVNANECGPVVGTAVIPIVPVPCPTPVITLPAAVCSGSAGNMASVSNVGAGAVYVWTITNGVITGGAGTSNISFRATVNTGLDTPANDSVRISVTVTSGGCSTSSGNYSVFITPLPNATITLAASVCAGSTGNMASVPFAGVGASYTWTVSNGNLLSGAGTNTITYRANSVGTVAITAVVRTAGGCTASTRKSTNIVPVPKPVITVAAGVCGGSAGNAASVADEGTGASYIWSITNGTINEGGNSNSVRFTAGASGIVSLSVTVVIGTGCSVTSPTRQVTIYAAPNATISSWASVCTNAVDNRASVLSAGAGATYTWSITGGSITAGQGTSSILYSAGVSGNLVLSVTVTAASGCSATSSRTVKIIQKVKTLFTQIAPVCQGSTAPLLPLKSNNGIVGTWSPALVNTNVTGTVNYVFTPAVGQCALPATMSITVQPCSIFASRSGNTGATVPGKHGRAGKLSATLMPNPAQAHFVLQLRGGANTLVDISVVDIAGRRIEQRRVTAGSSITLGEKYHRGVFLVEVISGDERIVLKAVKE